MSPEDLRKTTKWTRITSENGIAPITKLRLGDLFEIKRGIATGANKFFILSSEDAKAHKIPKRFLKPILPSPRNLGVDEILSNGSGLPVMEPQRFLLDCDLPEEKVREKHPSLWEYLEQGRATDVSGGYLCRSRRPWYSQEKRPPPALLCTYMGRKTAKRNGNPFRFILNHSEATATNVYLLLYPKSPAAQLLDNKETLRLVWKALQGLNPEVLREEGRVHGGGLYKLEPKELANIPADAIFPPGTLDALKGNTLF